MLVAILLACVSPPSGGGAPSPSPAPTTSTPPPEPTTLCDNSEYYATVPGKPALVADPVQGDVEVCVASYPGLSGWCAAQPGWDAQFGGCPTRDEFVVALAAGEVGGLYYGRARSASERLCTDASAAWSWIDIDEPCYDCRFLALLFDPEGALAGAKVADERYYTGWCCAGETVFAVWYGNPLPSGLSCGNATDLVVPTGGSGSY